jgi:hypothetical protein
MMMPSGSHAEKGVQGSGYPSTCAEQVLCSLEIVAALKAAQEALLSAAKDAVDIEVSDINATSAVNLFNFLFIDSAP